MLTKPTILYVEDEDGVRSKLSKLLTHFSSELYIAEDGEIGLELFKKYSPDIIITDIKMPVMNGITMVKMIKEIDSEQHIIFTTAHSESEYFIDAIETHVDGYILKPISFSILKQKLNQITKQINVEKELLAQQTLTNEITQMLNLLIVLDKNNNIIYSNKNFLKFIQNYATSKLFHSINRIKYRTSIDRNILLTNKYTLDNYESYHELNYQTSSKDGFEPFSLLHDVFGHQTGKEAFNSPEVFANAYTNATQKNWHFRYYHETLVNDDGTKIVDEETGATLYTPWIKEWGKVIPANSDNKYIVKDVAKWLWNHFVGDNGRNFGTLEKAHIYALLNGKDLGYFLYKLDTTRDPEHDYTVEELESFESEINDASISVMKINSDDKDERIESSRYIKYAVAFISALPYTFVEEGR